MTHFAHFPCPGENDPYVDYVDDAHIRMSAYCGYFHMICKHMASTSVHTDFLNEEDDLNTCKDKSNEKPEEVFLPILPVLSSPAQIKRSSFL